MQAGLICAEKNDDFIILEAAKVIGGRINTMTLGKLAEEGYFNASDKPWFTEKVKAVLLQFGATWISADQPYMNKLISDHNLQFCTQYDNGKYIYGESDG